MEFHQFSQLFPLSPAQDADVLTRSIKKHGLKHTIWTFEGKILDGRNRYIACKKAGVQPRFIEFNGTQEQALDFVVIQNLERRHLTHGQRTHIAVRLEALYSQEARDRQVSGTLASVDAKGKASEKAAEAMNVSSRSVERLKTVWKNSPRLATQVAQDKISVAAAYEKVKQSEKNGAMDDLGTGIPKEAEPYWNRKPEAEAILSKLRNARTTVKQLTHDDPMWAEVNLNGVIADLNSAINRFTAAVPTHVCPYCKGVKVDGCKTCKGRGCISNFMWSMLPAELHSMREGSTKAI